jgi:hypothetical protein
MHSQLSILSRLVPTLLPVEDSHHSEMVLVHIGWAMSFYARLKNCWQILKREQPRNWCHSQGAFVDAISIC